MLAYVLPDADPVHKVTILPTGMALGVTQQLPIEERHTYWREYIEDAVCVMMGGRCAESLILGSLSTGASNDLQRATEMARKMVREFGMSERIGPMAWGQEGQVFLGEDLMHAARDYSDVTSRVIDEEVERILREQEARATRLLSEHRHGLAAVAAALLEHETIDGAEVGRLVDEAYGRPVHEHVQLVPRFSEDESDGEGDRTPPRLRPGCSARPTVPSARTARAQSAQGLSGTPKLKSTPAAPFWPYTSDSTYTGDEAATTIGSSTTLRTWLRWTAARRPAGTVRAANGSEWPWFSPARTTRVGTEPGSYSTIQPSRALLAVPEASSQRVAAIWPPGSSPRPDQAEGVAAAMARSATTGTSLRLWSTAVWFRQGDAHFLVRKDRRHLLGTDRQVERLRHAQVEGHRQAELRGFGTGVVDHVLLAHAVRRPPARPGPFGPPTGRARVRVTPATGRPDRQRGRWRPGCRAGPHRLRAESPHRSSTPPGGRTEPSRWWRWPGGGMWSPRLTWRRPSGGMIRPWNGWGCSNP